MGQFIGHRRHDTANEKPGRLATTYQNTVSPGPSQRFGI